MVRLATLIAVTLVACTSDRGPRGITDAATDGGRADALTDGRMDDGGPSPDARILPDGSSDARVDARRDGGPDATTDAAGCTDECFDDDGCCTASCDAITDSDCLDDVTGWGTIFLGAYVYPTTTVSTASASFIGRTAATSSCTVTNDGVCVLYECPTTGPAPTVRYESAGRVTISGGTGAPIVMNPNPDRTYPPASFTEATPRWSSGAAITITASGASVPAFTLRGTFPSELTPLSPTPMMTPTGLRISATRSAGLRFTWTGERSGEAVAGLSQVVGTTSRSISCRFPAAGRSGTMSAALMSRLSPTGSDGTPATTVSLTYGGAPFETLAGDTLVRLWMNGSVGMSAQVDLR